MTDKNGDSAPAAKEPKTGEDAIYVVTGGGGFIGSHLVDHIRRERPEATIRVIDNFVTGRTENLAHLRDDPKVELTHHTIGHRPTLDKIMEGVDCVFHLAALASVPRSLKHPLETDIANSHGTLLIMDAAQRAGVRRVVYAGSSSAYGNQPGESKVETMGVGPLSPYAASKLAGEHYVRAYANCWDIEGVTVRYFNVFGPRQNPRSQYAAVIPIFAVQMLRGEQPTVHGDGTQSRDFTYVANVAKGTFLAGFAPAEKVNGQAVNVACGGEHSLLELVKELNEILETDLEPKFEDSRPGDVKRSRADISLAREAMGYEPDVSFADGLRETVEWYREQVQADMELAGISTPIKA
jgi:UDP-glucose 4-epimerase